MISIIRSLCRINEKGFDSNMQTIVRVSASKKEGLRDAIKGHSMRIRNSGVVIRMLRLAHK